LVTVVPAGAFQQGADRADAQALNSEQPAHRVAIARPFGLSTTEVTVAEFREFVSATQRAMRGCDLYDGRWHHDPAAS
jgi:formylglycine-generating enzyme required for sulfatase activity